MRVALTAAIMDLMHEGHINLLREMRDKADKIVVVLHDDESCFRIKGKLPIQDIWKRVQNLYISGLADEVLITHSIDPSEEFEKVIGWYDDIIFMRGSDNLDFPGRWMIDKHNIPVSFVDYTKGVSSTEIKKILCSL